MKLFILGEQDIELNSAEILLIDEFRAIYTRDTGSPIDPDGKYKLNAFKEFKYIYLVADYASPLQEEGLTRKELNKRAAAECGFPRAYEPDAVIKKAIERYTNLREQTSMEIKLYASLRQSFNNTYKLINKMSEVINEQLESMNPEDIKIAQANIKSLLDLAKDLPKSLEGFILAEKAARAAAANQRLMKGGDVIPDSADPK